MVQFRRPPCASREGYSRSFMTNVATEESFTAAHLDCHAKLTTDAAEDAGPNQDREWHGWTCYTPVPKVLKNQNPEVSHNPRRMENRTPPAIGSAQAGKLFERTMKTLARTAP